MRGTLELVPTKKLAAVCGCFRAFAARSASILTLAVSVNAEDARRSSVSIDGPTTVKAQTRYSDASQCCGDVRYVKRVEG